MQSRTFTNLAIVSILALAGCNGGSSPEKMVKQQVSATQDLGAALAKITDKASAEKHKGAVDAAINKMSALMKEMEALPADKQKAGQALAEKAGAEFQAAMGKVSAEIMRIASNTEIMGVLGPVLEKMDK